MRRTSTFLVAAFLLASGIAIAQTGKAFRVQGTTSGWMGSGLCFQKGDHVEIQVSGTLKHSSWDGQYHGPEGNPSSFCGSGCKPFTDSCNVAALVAKIGNGGRIHCVGNALAADISNDSGELYFGINDTPTSDNEGGFDLVVAGGRLCPSKNQTW